MSGRSEISAGGVVIRRVGGGVEVAVGSQNDRLTRVETLRLPKGIIEAGESSEEAARREVAEEIGIDARIVAPLGDAAYRYREGETEVSKRVHFFLMEHETGTLHPQDGEMCGARWVPIDEASRILTFDSERDMVERARAELGEGAA
jgi:8-oxo-dGTP pyrophosphatase MutT (NUDIX family)